MFRRSQLSQHAARFRSALTIVELLVGVGILVLVIGLVVVAGKSVQGSQARATAQQQIKLIAGAIDRYAGFWPKWKVGGVVVADRGWPDPFPGRLFDTGAFSLISGFNDSFTFNAANGVLVDFTGSRTDRVVPGNVMSANICLAYSLTDDSGKGPYLQVDGAGALFKDILEVVGSISNPLLPSPLPTSGGRRAMLLVDPWGTPYRYFWVYEEPNAFRGLLPVDYGPIVAGTGTGGVNNPAMFLPDGTRKTASGYILESAGPDQRFGNVWRIGPTNREINNAADNITTRL